MAPNIIRNLHCIPQICHWLAPFVFLLLIWPANAAQVNPKTCTPESCLTPQSARTPALLTGRLILRWYEFCSTMPGYGTWAGIAFSHSGQSQYGSDRYLAPAALQSRCFIGSWSSSMLSLLMGKCMHTAALHSGAAQCQLRHYFFSPLFSCLSCFASLVPHTVRVAGFPTHSLHCIDAGLVSTVATLLPK